MYYQLKSRPSRRSARLRPFDLYNPDLFAVFGQNAFVDEIDGPDKSMKDLVINAIQSVKKRLPDLLCMLLRKVRINPDCLFRGAENNVLPVVHRLILLHKS